jgi:UDP-N-acetylglucosamine 4-epimerase
MKQFSDKFQRLKVDLQEQPRIWLVSGVAGFIGSHLLETLLSLDQTVVGLDSLATGYRHNLDDVQKTVTEDQWKRFRFLQGDICDANTCREATRGVDFVLHQAALGSVPRSIKDPVRSNEANVSGFLNMLMAAHQAGVKSFTYASSSSIYGDNPRLPKVEDVIGRPLSPYAVTKYVNEVYASVFQKCYSFPATGLRYFNVFGPRQDPNGAYAAVIPKWIQSLLLEEQVVINGDGESSRDFCFVDNAVQANLLAATAPLKARGDVYNVAVGDRTSLNTIFHWLALFLKERKGACDVSPRYQEFRPGDVRHSQASIDKIVSDLEYFPLIRVKEGLHRTFDWFWERANRSQ